MTKEYEPNAAGVFTFWALLAFALVMVFFGEFKAALPCITGAFLIITIEVFILRRKHDAEDD